MVELNVMLYMKHLAWELALNRHSVFEQMPLSLYWYLIGLCLLKPYCWYLTCVSFIRFATVRYDQGAKNIEPVHAPDQLQCE